MPDSEKKGPWTRLSSRVVYDNPWIEVRHEEVLTPAGTDGIYGVIHFKNIAVGIVPVDADGNTWLVRQFRYTLGQPSWEIPEGGCLEGSDTALAALRELQEETGLSAQKLSVLMHMHTSNSVTDERAIIYLAEDLAEGEATPEATEDIEVLKLPLATAIQWAAEGKITDALSVAALLFMDRKLRTS